MPASLSTSILGTREYWDEVYSTDLRNHINSPQNKGTIWFEESGVEKRVINFLDHLAVNPQNPLQKSSATIIDVGTGNGHMLFQLRKRGWTGSMLGIDYSLQSIALARAIGQRQAREQVIGEPPSSRDASRDPPSFGDNFSFMVHDVLEQDGDKLLKMFPNTSKGYDIVLDKGTFDAISLSGGVTEQGNPICSIYPNKIFRLMRPNALFIITSCNWSKEELIDWFITNQPFCFHVFHVIDYPKFTFGGKTGQTVTTICFRRIQSPNLRS